MCVQALLSVKRYSHMYHSTVQGSFVKTYVLQHCSRFHFPDLIGKIGKVQCLFVSANNWVRKDCMFSLYSHPFKARFLMSFECVYIFCNHFAHWVCCSCHDKFCLLWMFVIESEGCGGGSNACEGKDSVHVRRLKANC